MTTWGGGPGQHPDSGQMAFGAAPPFEPVGREELIVGLTPPQTASVVHRGGPLLIVAGAGTGKTATLVHRVAWLIAKGTDPGRILLLTFTRRAAAEIEQIDACAPQCLLPKVKPDAPVMIWLHLADALDSDDEKTALRLLSMALASGNDARNLSSFFASYASRNDGRLYGMADMQYVCATLLAFARSRPLAQNRLLAALVRFLTFCEKDHALWDTLANGG